MHPVIVIVVVLVAVIVTVTVTVTVTVGVAEVVVGSDIERAVARVQTHEHVMK